MMLRTRSLDTLLRRTLAAVLLASLAAAASAAAQTRWTVDPKASLAWWQMNPHLSHLWGTTCPEEPSWRPGEGRSGGWNISQGFRAANDGQGSLSDTNNIPIYPRPKVRSVCAPGVRGQFVVADVRTLRGTSGDVIVKAEALITGNDDRDAYTRGAILQTNRWSEIKYAIDSVVNVTHRADTTFGTARGTLTIRDVTKPMSAGIRAWPLADGAVRVMTRFHTPADGLVPEWGLSKFSLGLGVGLRMWRDLYMGADLVLRPE